MKPMGTSIYFYANTYFLNMIFNEQNRSEILFRD